MDTKKQIQELLGQWVPLVPIIDIEKLPVYMQEVLKKFLIPKNLKTPLSLLILNLNAKSAQLVAHNRTSFLFPNESNPIPLNLYGLAFADSGVGKSRSARNIDRSLFKHFYAEFDEQKKVYVDNEKQKRLMEAKEMYPKSKSQQNNYVRDNKPRELAADFSDATTEGFVALRNAFNLAGFGSTFVEIQEFADFITSDNRSRTEFLSALTDAFDHGDLGAKIIKGDKTTAPTRGIPSNALLYSSPADLLSGAANKKLMTFLSRGMARRSYVCFPNETEYPVIFSGDIREKLAIEFKKKLEAEQHVEELIQYFVKTFYATQENPILKVTPDALFMYEIYQEYCDIRHSEIKIKTNEGLKAELLGRSWKMIKLAGIIACFEHPDQLEIRSKDVAHAIYLTEIFGFHFARFYSAEVVTDNEKLLNFLITNSDTWYTKTDIRKQSFVQGKDFSHWFTQNIKLVDEMAEDEGYILIEEKHNKNGKKYKVIPIEIIAPESLTVKLSVSKNADKAKDYIPEVFKFEELHKIVNSKCNYSGSIFKDNYRKIENCIELSNLLILDIDNGTTIEEAKNKLNEFKFLITTSRNHQKIKGTKPACDRFRIFIPLYDALPNNNKEYKEIVKNIIHTLDLIADEAAIEISRIYFGNPEGEYFYGQSNKLLNWTLFKPIPQQSDDTNKKSSMPMVRTCTNSFAPLVEVLGTDQALKRYSFYDPDNGCIEGNIDNFLRRIAVWLRDEGISKYLIDKEIDWLKSLPPIRGKNTHTDTDLKRLTRDC